MINYSNKQRKNKAKKIKQSFYLLFIVLFFLYVLVNQTIAAPGVPNILNHQGRLLDLSGNLLGGSSGTDYCFSFSIYDDATVGAPDNKLWPSGDPKTMIVNVKNGIFNAGIGDTAATCVGGTCDSLDFNFQDNDTVYLNVKVAAQVVLGSCAGVSLENLSPRQQIVSSGYAINASTVLGSGQSAIGTTTPASSTVLTVEATSTAAVPMAIRGFFNQVADLFRIITSTGSQLLTFTSGGKMGIGSSTPSAMLSIRGGGLTTGRAFTISNADEEEKFTVLDNGNVGIGSSSPGALFSVGSIGTGLQINSSGSITTGSWHGTTIDVDHGGTGSTTLSGILKGAGTGMMATAVAGDFPTLNQSTTGSAATLTTSRSIYGNSFNGSTDLAQAIGTTYGGTGLGAGGLASTFIPYGAGASPFATSSTFFFTADPGRLNFSYASSTAFSSTYASSTIANFGSLTLPNLGTVAGTFLAVNANGLVIATTTPSGGSITLTGAVTGTGSGSITTTYAGILGTTLGGTGLGAGGLAS
ncbi:MAG: hypothetical protein ABIB72_01285, partial [Candidatus Falkowbacteria bacterium]